MNQERLEHRVCMFSWDLPPWALKVGWFELFNVKTLGEKFSNTPVFYRGYDIATLVQKNHYPATKLLVLLPNEQLVILAKKWNWQQQKLTSTCWWLALWAPFSRNRILNHKHQVLDVACVKFMITMRQNNVKQPGMLWRSVFGMRYGRRLTQNSATGHSKTSWYI